MASRAQTGDATGAKASSSAHPIPALSSSERRLVNLVASGRTNREIATELDMVEQSVKNLLSGIYRKCAVRNRAELVRLAFTMGLVALTA